MLRFVSLSVTFVTTRRNSALIPQVSVIPSSPWGAFPPHKFLTVDGMRHLLACTFCHPFPKGHPLKKVPLGGGSCHMSPASIMFNPPKGRAEASSFAYLTCAKSQTSSRQRKLQASQKFCADHINLIYDEPSPRSKRSRKPFPGNCQHLSQPHAPPLCF